MNDPVLLRKVLRESLAMAPTRWHIETLLYRTMQQMVPGVSVREFHAARNWNQSEGYIEGRANRHFDEDEWKLTPAGLKQEGL